MSDKFDFERNPIYGKVDKDVSLVLQKIGNETANIANIEKKNFFEEKDDSGRISFS